MDVEKIYFDMDGVLADFERGVIELCGVNPLSQNAKRRNPKADDEMWTRIKEVPNFYDKLRIMDGAKELFDELYEKYGDKCEILSGVPKEERGITSAGEDKIKWIRRLFSPTIKVNIVLRKEKQGYCNGPGYILIDDYEKTIKEWEEKGGTGIAHVNAETTKNRLKELGVL